FTLLVGALAASIAAAAVAAGLAAFGASEAMATLGALAFALATPLFPHATLAQQTPVGAAAVALGVAALLRQGDRREHRGAGGERAAGDRTWALAGVALGSAVLADYHAFYAVAPLGVAVLLGRGRREAALVALGMVGPIVLLLATHAVITGN